MEGLRFRGKSDEPGAVVEALAIVFESRDMRWPSVLEHFNAMRSLRPGGLTIFAKNVILLLWI